MNSREQRNIPFWVGIVMFLSKPLSIFGLVFFIMGGFATYMMSGDVLFKQQNIEDNDPITKGIITRVKTVSDEEGTTTYIHFYKFITDRGETIRNSSEHFKIIAEPGDTLSVQYNPDNPGKSRFTDFEEMDLSYLYIVLLFPLVGIIIIVFGLIDVMKKVRIMRIGHTAYGTFEGKEATGVRINDRNVYAMFFKFTAPNGKEYKITTKTHQKKRLQDDEKELIIFDLQNPNKAFPVDVLPNFAKQFILEDHKNYKSDGYKHFQHTNLPLRERILQFFPPTKITLFGVVFTILGGFVSVILFIEMIKTQKSIEDTDPVAQGIVIDIKHAGIIINNKEVCDYYYEFTTVSGKKIQSSSQYFEGTAELNDILSVQYNPDNPQESRLTEFEEVNTHWGLYIALFFMFAGIIMLAAQKLKAMKFF